MGKYGYVSPPRHCKVRSNPKATGGKATVFLMNHKNCHFDNITPIFHQNTRVFMGILQQKMVALLPFS
jgi:hypothetical protein